MAAFHGIEKFYSADQLAVIRDVRNELKSRHPVEFVKELRSIVSKLSCNDRRTILRGKDTGQCWLLVLLPSATVNGTEIYSRSPADLPSHCDGCSQKFTVQERCSCDLAS
jgi:hypothetical protein